MGFGGSGIWQLLIILVIVLLLFGTKRLRNLGGDLGNAIKGFRGAMSDGEKEKEKEKEQLEQKEEKVIEGEATASEPASVPGIERLSTADALASPGRSASSSHSAPPPETTSRINSDAPRSSCGPPARGEAL